MNTSYTHAFEERYRSAVLRRFQLTSDSEAVVLLSSGHVRVLSRRDAERLSVCSEFLTLREHADKIFRHSSSDARQAERGLHELVACGALIPYSELMAHCTPTQDIPDSGRRVTWLTVPTRSRPNELIAAVESSVQNSRAFGHNTRVFVSDQSPLESERHNCRSRLRGLMAKRDVEVLYAGQEEKEAFARQLTLDGEIPLEVVRFGLFGSVEADANIGANRNAILLQTLDELLISVDDDTRCETGSAPEAGSNIRFGNGRDPTEVWFFADRISGRQFVRQTPIDMVGMHEQLLGRRLREILVRESSVDVTSMCDHILADLWSDRGAVVCTYGGLAGDAGFYSAHPIMIHPSRATRERLTSSEQTYKQNIHSREIVRQALLPTVSHGMGAISLAAFCGLDNRQLLPPFLPPFRSEDGVFGYMIGWCLEGSCFGHLPITILHDRPDARCFGDIATMRMSDLVLGALASCPKGTSSTSCADRLRSLGKHLMYLGALAGGGFREWAQGAVLARASGITRVSEVALKQSSCYPEYWAEDLSQTIERLSRKVSEPDYLVPEELRAAGGLDAAQQILKQFGDLLYWWPAIVERTRRLAAAGVQIGRRLC